MLRGTGDGGGSGASAALPELQARVDELEAKLARATARADAADEKAEHLLDTLPIFLAEIDRDWRITAVRGRLLDLLGRPPEAFVGKRYSEHVPGAVFRDHHGRVAPMTSLPPRAFAGETVVGTLEVRGLHYDYRVSPRRDRAGTVVGFFVTAFDSTEHRALEGKLRQSQKMEAIGQLAGGVAHDFNNLLTVILCCAEEMEEELAAVASPLAEGVGEILGAAERARELTRQLLAFARKQDAVPVALDVNAVVLGCEKMLRRVVGENVEVEARLEPGLAPVLCDPGLLEQVIVNLAVNAKDAMPEGGRLLIETRSGTGDTPPETAEDGGGGAPTAWVRLLVGDNGVGLTPEAKLHLFEPFFTTKEMGRGTGLGLATVHGIVAQSGGHIQVTSRPGEGTTFEISLPTTDKLPTAAAVYKPGRPVIRGMELVLVVEDDSRVRAATVRALESAGYEVVVAANGIEALAIQPGELARVKLLLTDVIMPGHMSGVAIAASLTARHPTLRVLYVSGHAEDALLYRRVLDPGVEFLSKPFTSSSLLGRVRNVLDA